jgi:hypothetical protein
MKKKLNQQGTLKKDSSETICVKDLDLNLSKGFINWFSGFVEGNENIFIVNRRYLRFELNCSFKNQSTVYYIKNILGFGNIRKLKFLDTIIIEYSVQDNVVDLLKLVKIFNGNLRCISKKQYFKLWYKKLQVKLKKMNLLDLLPDYIEDIKSINLLNSWLLGYIDSRVFFYGRWHKSKKLKEGKELYLCCIFWHLNKDLLLKIKEVLNLSNKIEEKTKWNLPFFKLIVDNIDEKNRICEYLIKFKLKTLKLNKFKNWKKLLDFENEYKKTGVQDLKKIEKNLKNLLLNEDEDELNKI